MKIDILKLGDTRYPTALAEIYNPPAQLYLKGKLDGAHFNVAVVGMRKPSAYGERACRDIVRGLAQAGLQIVSGLAYGIDSIAHRVALECGTKTVGVLGSGFNNIYPATHSALANQISKQGALISEYEPDQTPARHTFVQRNRIIVGLAQAVIVVEAAERSGSLISAELALQEGRDLWAVPGSIFASQSQGTNRLISLGAAPLLDSRQFLQYYNLDEVVLGDTVCSDSQSLIIKMVNKEDGVTIEKLSRECKIIKEEMFKHLTDLEITGRIKNCNGKIYLR